VAAFLHAEGNATQAIPKFRELCERDGIECPVHAGRFIKRWGQRWLQYNTLSNRRGRGHHSKLSPQLVDAAVDRFTDGYPGHAPKVHYTSFATALEWDHELAALVARSGVKPATFWLHMVQVGASTIPLPACLCTAWHLLQRMAHSPVLVACCCCWLQSCPHMVKVPERVKPAFTDDIKQQRIAAGRHNLQLLEKNPEQWHYEGGHMPRVLADMVFVDQASLRVVPGSGRVWVSMLKEKEREHIVVDEQLGGHHGFTISWYAAVNAQEGPLDP